MAPYGLRSEDRGQAPNCRGQRLLGGGSESLGVRVWGFRGTGFSGLGFRGLGFKSLGFGFQGLGFRGLGV